MSRNSLLVLMMLSTSLFTEALNAQPAQNIRIVGNSVLSANKLIDAIKMEEGESLTRTNLESRLDTIISLYKNEGYKFARIKECSIDSLGSVTIFIDEGRIGQITIRGNTRTKDRIIRQELLFKEGEVYDEDIVAESERNLRARQIFGEVEITPKYNDTTELVDVNVKVTDIWTLFPVPIPPMGGGGELVFGFIVMDLNLLGYGQALLANYIYEREASETKHAFGINFCEPRTFGSHWMTELQLQKSTDGYDWHLGVNRPLYSLATKWAIRTYVGSSTSIEYWYEGGQVTDKYRAWYKRGELSGTLSYGEKIKTRFSVGYYFSDRRYKILEHRLPSSISLKPIRRSTLKGALNRSKFDYVKETFINGLGKVEDIELGYRYGGSFGGSLKLLGSYRNEVRLSLSGYLSRKFKNSHYLSLDVDFDQDFWEGSFHNVILDADACYYIKFADRNHTLAFHVKTKYGYELEGPEQFLLGASNGLRGYKAERFDGNKLFLLNIEDRILVLNSKYLVLDIVPFIDVGQVWKPNEQIDLIGIARDVGLGIRFFCPFMFCPVLRLDVGYGLTIENSVQISFGTEQVFGTHGGF